MVVRVLDGYTIVVQHGGKPETVRLIGVDTPEEVDSGTPVQYFAREATRFITQITLNQQMRLELQESPGSRDGNGRLLAYVFRQTDGLFVNKEIIKQGFGFAYLKHRFDPERMDDFRATEREARESKRGLWAPVVDKYHEMTVPKYEPRAESWLIMGDNLAKANAAGAKGWYEKIVNEYPRSTQCPIARGRLKLPPAQEIVFPALDGEVAMSLLQKVQDWPIGESHLPAPTTSSEEAARHSRRSSIRLSQSELEKKQKAESESAFSPAHRSQSTRNTPGTRAHVRRYTERKGNGP
ncbi:MAG: thermonuclease family protein [Isosphaeraceae bacterium]